MSILLTGGMGYLGSHTAVSLSELGYEVVLYDNLSNSDEGVLLNLRRVIKQGLSFVQGDVRDTHLLTKVLKNHGIKAVIHFAGLKSVKESVDHPFDYYACNVQGTLSVVAAMQLANIYTLIFSSSATVYGEPVYLPFDEKHRTCAVNTYGRTKLHAEQMLQDLAESDPMWGVVCLRYFNPIGAHVSGLIGESPNGVPDNLMPYVCQVAAGHQPDLKVFGKDYATQDGTGVRDYIDVNDLALGHVSALKYLRRHRGWQAINLGVGKGASVLDIIEAFERVNKIKVPYSFHPRRKGDIGSYYSDPTLALNLLKWKAHRSLEDSCASAWNFYHSTGMK